MRKLKSFTLLSFISIIIFSCSSEENLKSANIEGDLVDYATDTIYFEKDLNTKSLPLEFTYQKEGDKEFLYGMSGFNLLKYEYPSGKLISNITLEKEGPDGIGGYFSGKLITSDGIFFISNQKEVIHIDFDGKVSKRISLPFTSADRMAANFSAQQGNKMYWDSERQTLMVTDVPFLLKEPILNYRDWIWEFDFKEEKKEVTAQFKFPEPYSEFLDDPELGIYFHLFLKDKNQHLVGFPASDSLLVIQDDQKSKVYAGSNEKLEFKKGITEARGEYIVFSPSVETSRYKWMMHDPYQGLILRHLIIQQGQNENIIFSKNSFILLDESLSKVGEVKFSDREINNFGFSTPNGFYLKTGSQESDDKEGYIRFNF